MKQLQIHDLSKKFDQKIIFENANFDFSQGQIYGLLGRNGSGKSTLFNLIARNIPFDAGEIQIDSDEGAGLTGDYPDLAVEMVYTQPHLPSFMTAREFVTFFTQINSQRLMNVNSSQKPREYLELAGLSADDANKLLRDYSQGMLNKLQLVVALMLKPPVLLLDEPLTTVDVVAAHEMQQLIVSMKQDSVIIFSTHIMQLAQNLCDQVVLLHHQQLEELPGLDLHSEAFENAVIERLTDEINDDQN
ncbi:ATP-binding cassette domain-containing protein [Xylocopilactobacillus apicola]|uniref:ABC transporter ATP-binding protein n=1 Tax=Xylocopilactobacillus apicola TaxID=2932184 RepID=A0AAU9D722_9LACO|nr:ABC transporter ATP-binding protein [Xylocopilactobacillus apicola]BDR59353.1 ABC transporter ATP-binding protein [Xylocopilactobacillus apicola]